MVKDITAWIREELYPVLFDRIPEALPEHNWTQDGRGWRSKTYLDGSPHKDRSDKTKILKAQPGYIFEEGNPPGKGLVDYVKERDRLPFIDAVKKLAAVAGLQLPSLDVKDQEAYRKAQQRTGLLEEATSYMAWSLQHADGKRADAVREYLQGRGWTMAEVEAVGLGYLPGWVKLKAYLLSKGHTEEEVEEALTIGKDGRLGDTHTLAIPYRSGSRILGYAFRTVTEAEPKYLNSTGMDRKAGLFNLSPLKGEKDLVVVEGYLDALHATAKGLENVVAVGSDRLGEEHVQDAMAKGARKVTLCLDADEAGKNGTDKALEVLKAFPRLKVYVAELPAGADGGKMDPDQLIQEQGIDALRAVVAGAITAWEYQLGQLLEPFTKGELLPKEVDQLLERSVTIANDLVDPMDRDRFTSAFLFQVQGLGVTKESLLGAQEQLRYEKDREKQRKDLVSLVSTVNREIEKDPTAAIDQLEEGLRGLRRERGSTLLQPITYSGWLDHMGKSPPALRTGYADLDKVARIPQAAITLVAGRPRHGKTTVMMNLLMSMAELYPGKRFLFFTYEEPSAHILTKLLNSTLGADLQDRYREYEEASTNYSYLGAYLRSGRTDVTEVEAAKDKLRSLMDSGRIQVIDGSYTVEDLRAILEALPAEEVGAVFLDYIQRMSTAKQTQDKRTEIAHISDQLLQIAKGTGLPLILGAQLNRAGASSTDKRPSLENLKEAGNLEEDANLVLSVYNESAEKEAPDGGTWGREVTLELRALKNRDGAPNGKAELILDSWTGKVKEGSTKWQTL